MTLSRGHLEMCSGNLGILIKLLYTCGYGRYRPYENYKSYKKLNQGTLYVQIFVTPFGIHWVVLYKTVGL